MPGSDGQSAVSEQLGTGTSWGWGYNIAPRFNFKVSDEQTIALATFFKKATGTIALITSIARCLAARFSTTMPFTVAIGKIDAET